MKISSKYNVFCIKGFLVLFSYFILNTLCLIQTTFAITDPLSVPNNRFGIHLIQATHDESSPAAQLVNSSGGDWGYITVLIEGKDKSRDKWQAFFDDLRRRHLIPLVRLATIPDSGGFWKRPDIGEAQVWADFLDSLNWPVKNRYVTIYNEPNHAQEWGNSVDAKSYAEILDQTITALKNKNQDFFVLNGGFDASTPQQLPKYQEESSFLQAMDESVPGIFNKLDGWVSHSYPNPGFVGSPEAFGKGTVRTYLWEQEILKDLRVTKKMPIFITETGWKHAEGLAYDANLPKADTLSDYYTSAFQSAWNDPQIAAVTPFLLSYQEVPFDHFSFKMPTGEKQQEKLPNPQVLGIQYPQYYSFYQTVMNLPKQTGKPIQDNLFKLIKGEVYSSIVAGEVYQISLTFQNTGQSIWNDPSLDGLGQVRLVPIEGSMELGLEKAEIPQEVKVEPGKEYTFSMKLKAPDKGIFKVKLNLFSGSKEFDSKEVEFTTQVKQPVILQILSNLQWKKSAAGQYFLKVSGVIGDSSQKVVLDDQGKSEQLEARYLLPDYSFDFTLEKPYYHPKTIHQELQPGVNVLDFGVMQPSLFEALLHPKEFWKLLPWSK